MVNLIRMRCGLALLAVLSMACSHRNTAPVPNAAAPLPDSTVSGTWIGTMDFSVPTPGQRSIILRLHQEGQRVTGSLDLSIDSLITPTVWPADSLRFNLPNRLEGGIAFHGLPVGGILRGEHWGYFNGTPYGNKGLWRAVRQ
jgi:hypothetical protein